MRRLDQSRRRRSFGRRAVPARRSRQGLVTAVVIAAPLAGVLAAIVALYANSGSLGLLVAAIAFIALACLLSVPSAPDRAG